MSWGVCIMVKFYAFLLLVLFGAGFVLLHFSGWFFALGLACLFCAGLIGAKLTRKEEEEKNPYI